jgi:hypothetical protein
MAEPADRRRNRAVVVPERLVAVTLRVRCALVYSGGPEKN